MTNKKRNTAFRGQFFSVVLNPLDDDAVSKWNSLNTNDEKTLYLMNRSFPLYTEVASKLDKLEAEKVNNRGPLKPEYYAFGTETSTVNKLPHYQIYLDFGKQVMTTTVLEGVKELFEGRAYCNVMKVFDKEYQEYCIKEHDRFDFVSKYYWNVKLTKMKYKESLVDLRPKLKEVESNLYSAQSLLNEIILSEPDDRSIIWIPDVIGGTGKTAGMQATLSNEKEYGMTYVKITRGTERLSAKIVKRIEKYREKNKGKYPRGIWINFGRTVREDVLKEFSGTAEDLVDGMLDHNFGNTGGADITFLPYMHIVVTANTPPNLKQLTDDRWCILSFYPIKEDGKRVDSVMVPVFVDIQVKIEPKTQMVALQYRYKNNLSSTYKTTFCDRSWFPTLEANVTKFKLLNKEPMVGKWVSAYKHEIPNDVLDVYLYALNNMDYSLSEDGFKEYVTTIKSSFDMRNNSPGRVIKNKANKESVVSSSILAAAASSDPINTM